MTQMFPYNAWYCGALSRELTNKPLGRVLLKEPIVFYRKANGAVVALEDVCAHRRAPLHEGTLDGDNIQCPYHGVVFNCSGAAVWAQGTGKIPRAMNVRAYPVAERHGWIWIWMGDPTCADESKILDCYICVDPKWAVISGVMHVRGNAALAVDNLMDLSHTAFVHKGTVGSKDDLNPELTWKRGDNWITGTRTAYGLPPAPQQSAWGADCRLDMTKTMTYHPPFNVNVDIYTTESGHKLGDGRYNEQFLTFNLITPETDKTSYYFWANARNYLIDDQEYTRRNLENALKLLETEDKWIIEETQRMIDLKPSRPEVDLVADAGGLHARRILKRMIEAESAAPISAAAE